LWGGGIPLERKNNYDKRENVDMINVELRKVNIGGHNWDIPMYLPEIQELPEGDDSMSVIVSQRGIAKMEFFHRARIIRRDITDLTRIEFGIHSNKQPSIFNRELPEYDKILLEEFSINLRNTAREMMYNIVKANTLSSSGN
jgi:hypothetical protein